MNPPASHVRATCTALTKNMTAFRLALTWAPLADLEDLNVNGHLRVIRAQSMAASASGQLRTPYLHRWQLLIESLARNWKNLQTPSQPRTDFFSVHLPQAQAAESLQSSPPIMSVSPLPSRDRLLVCVIAPSCHSSSTGITFAESAAVSVLVLCSRVRVADYLVTAVGCCGFRR